MALRSGPWKTLRAAATYAANDTWYACTDTIEMGLHANCVRLYATVAVASAGDIEFYVQHSPDGGTTYFDYCGSDDAPEIWGKLVFSAAGTKSLELAGINLPPKEVVKVWFRCSAGAASATLKIQALAFESASSATDIATGDIEASVGDVEIENKYKPVVVNATGAGAINTTTAMANHFELLSITLLWGALPGTTSEDFTITVNANDGAAYKVVPVTIDFTEFAATDLSWTFEGGLDLPRYYEAGDEIVVAFTNTDAKTYGLRIVTRRV